MPSRRGSFASTTLKNSLRNCRKSSSLPSMIAKLLMKKNGSDIVTPFCSVSFGSAQHMCASPGEASGGSASPPFSSPAARGFWAAGYRRALRQPGTLLLLLTPPVPGHAPRLVHVQDLDHEQHHKA